MPADVTVSIVSHGQNALANQLTGDIARLCGARASLVLTQNAPDPTPLAAGDSALPAEILSNNAAKGFGANHNAAFARCRTPYFCVANPDVRLEADPFQRLIDTLEKSRAAVVGPLVRSPAGNVEDNARRFPSLASLLGKTFRRQSGPDYPTGLGAQKVDWLAGMFMLFASDAFRAVGGFDEAYFLYYEDVDICHRLRKSGAMVVYEPEAEVVHDARRGSHRNLRLALHHGTGILRFLSRRGSRAFLY